MACLSSRANHPRLNDEISPFRNPDDAANDETNGTTSLIERAETLKNTLQDVNVGEEVRRVAERKCDTVTRLKPAEWRVSILLLSFACGSPSFQTVL